MRPPTIRTDSFGDAVLIKHADGPQCARLRHEAEVLAVAAAGLAMDGLADRIAECVGFAEFEDRCELHLRHIDAAPLNQCGPIGLAQALDLLIDLGTTVSRLAAHGISHGALRSEHVLAMPPGTAVLCGFGEATWPGDTIARSPAADVGDLGQLATALLLDIDDADLDAPSRASRGEALNGCAELIGASSAAAHGADPLSEWIARMGTIRKGLFATQPGSGLGYVAAPTPEHDRMPEDLRLRLRAEGAGRPAGLTTAKTGTSPPAESANRFGAPAQPRRIGSYAAMIALTALAGFIGWRALANSSGAQSGGIGDASGIGATSESTTGRAGDAESLGDRSGPDSGGDAAGVPIGGDGQDGPDGGVTLLYPTTSPPCPEEDDPAPTAEPSAARSDISAYVADVVGDGCPIAVRVAAVDQSSSSVRSSVRWGPHEWTLSAQADLVAVGDWDCDGRATVAVVDAVRGLLSFFASWPASDHDVAPAEVIAVPTGATGLSLAAPRLLDNPDGGQANAPVDVPANEPVGVPAACDAVSVHYGDQRLRVALPGPLDHAPVLRRG